MKKVKSSKLKVKSYNLKLKTEIKSETRFLNEIKGVLYDKKWVKNAPNFELYYMYRGVRKKNGLRYDITIIPSRMLGKEFVKTLGHEHSDNYQELYTILEGQAIFLLQKYKNNKIEDVYAIRAKKGDVVITPKGYGHLTINPSKNKKLIEGNWTSERCKNIYDLFLKKQGASYYYTKAGWIKNKNYKKIPKLRFEKPLKSAPKDLSFLKN